MGRFHWTPRRGIRDPINLSGDQQERTLRVGLLVAWDGLMSRLRLPSVYGGGLMNGETQDYEIELKPGVYVYSCPLNTKPDYKLS